ncbi:hypothetical protein BHE74_00041582 [Ensete ventricosum]|nr:hypothetical protein BHE74_00041582 [Ensete ventricosum]
MKRRLAEEEGDLGRKRPQVAAAEEGSGFFSSLSDDLVVAILCRLSASAARPSDLLGVLIAGLSLMARAAICNHMEALYSLAVIHFNGSGRSNRHKDLSAGVALCARAAYLGHEDAIRDLGHCLQDGYGVPPNAAKGCRFLLLANTRELAVVLSTSSSSLPHCRRLCSLSRDFWCSTLARAPHPANQFMVEWFAARGGVVVDNEGLSLCSYGGCGRPETRRLEFRRCSACGVASYCSRACQVLHWKLAHKAECLPIERWLDLAAAATDGAPAHGGYL